MKTVIITGANGNLGSAVTRKFLEDGYRVIATVIHDSMKSDMPAHENLEIAVIDLSNETATASFITEAINKYKQIDAALLLVGGFAMGAIASTDMAAIQKQISLNFATAYHAARPLFEHMIGNNNGRLVFIGARPAINARQGKNMIAYALSKSLLFKLAEFLNEEARGKNVTATVVVPSTIDTPVNRKEMPEANPAHWVAPRQLAEILAFLTSGSGSSLRETVLKVYNNA